MAAPDATCQGDVRKLARFFETLAASSEEDTSKRISSETSNGKGRAGPYSPVEFREPVTGGDARMIIRSLSGPYSASEGYHVNSEQKFREPVVGGDAPLFTSLSRPFNEGYHVYSKRTVAYTPVDFKGSSVAGEDERPCVPCNECSKEHPPYSDCPYMPCRVCYKVHYVGNCPYFNHLPRGATFNPCYEIVCGCGNEFNEDKWVCTFCCGSRPVLTVKHCSICNSSKEHSSHECPNDKVRAAEYKLTRDLLLSVGPMMIPYEQVYIPE